ncbi:MAG TPA: DNA mismatch repair protein MutS [Acidobacteriota bacterium]|nr:DNA mismatch repair protein MutS [Acidobacteriota bacterium]
MSNKPDYGDNLTPLMRQYQAVKEQHPDKILFFRMGDFYEMFGDDAVKAAPLLGIVLTSRSHGNSERIPLAGVPYHAVERYLAKLLAAGEKVVIVEQVEDPKTARGLVKREIVEILTPGTADVEDPARPHRPACLAAVCERNGKSLGLAVLDFSTGAFLVDEGPTERIVERLRVAEPAEILYPSELGAEQTARLVGLPADSRQLTGFDDWNFDYKTAQRDLNQHFGTATLEGFGVRDSRLAVSAAGAIFRYLRENHRDRLSHIHRLGRFDDAELMSLDYNSVRNLELVRNLSTGSEENSLFSVINMCHTAGGARRLQNALLRPFRVRSKIALRLTGVTELVKNHDLCFRLRKHTKQLPDLERLAGRLGMGKLNPRQLAAISTGLQIGAQIRSLLRECSGPHLVGICDTLPDNDSLIARIGAALVDDPPMAANKGNIFRRGHSEKLDQLNDSIKDAREYIGSLQKIERERTGINVLKVGYNKVFGYYLEVTRANVGLVPKEYIRKQTLVNAERYVTPELKEKEELILAAEERIFKLEEDLFDELVEYVNDHIAQIFHTADLLSEFDLVSSLAELAVNRGYQCPEIYEDGRLVIENGRHPVIEAVLPPGSFVANDLRMDDRDDLIVILTGPNMSGKSTYLRQIGLIVILAQIGSYVPADRAEIGLVDRVFTRVGALDNLARGQSTFLVEMVEAANILNNATERSLVLLDEVGRGTSTFDGLSVAWSVVEYINEHNRCRTVFATHYHELTGMASLYDRVHNFQVAVKKWENRVIFLHKIIAGGCDDSYGIEVAKLAGLPRQAVSRSKQILKLLESGRFSQSELGRRIYTEKVQPSLFEPGPSEAEAGIRKLDLDNMTPVQVVDFVRKLKKELD